MGNCAKMKKFEMYGEKFNIKESNASFMSYHEETGIPVVSGSKTLQKCYKDTLALLEKQGQDKLDKALADYHRAELWNADLPIKVEDFKRIFSIDPYKFNTNWGNLWHKFHFDIMAFDKWLKTPDGTSTKQHLTNKYSKDAADLVSWFIQ